MCIRDRYKKTLNMPKSGFPMRAGLPAREPEMLKHWEEPVSYTHLDVYKRQFFFSSAL